MIIPTETKKDYRSAKLYLIALISSLGALTWGYNLTVFNSVKTFLENDVFSSASTLSFSLIASMPTFGAAFASFFSGQIMAMIGRRRILILADILSILGSILSMIGVLPLIIIGRILVGLAIGINNVAVPLYNVEMSPIKIKGIMTAMFMIMLALGQFLGLTVQFLMEGQDKTSQVWRVLFGLPIVLNLIRLITFYAILRFETPFYLVLKGHIGGAKTVLNKIIYTDNIDQHLEKVIKDKEASTSNGKLTLLDMVSPRYRKAFLLGVFIYASVQLCGFGPIFLFFNSFITESAKGETATLSLFSTLMGFISFFFTIVTALTIERFGRKQLLTGGLAFLILLTLVFAFISYAYGPANPALKYILIFWPAFYRLSIGTIGPVYVSELLPGIGVAFSTFVCWATGFLLTEFFTSLVNAIEIRGVMLLFGAFSLITMFVTLSFLVESKGKTKAELLQAYNQPKHVLLEDTDTLEIFPKK